jgi:radical SAM superfamily enzyme YgiQ (UPF0313 family)
MPDILLTSLNAKYIHASLGLRCLFANMGEMEARTRLIEFTLQHRPAEIVEALLANEPKIVGFGVYIWNAEETLRTVALLKTLRPDVAVVLGGPEVSFETESQPVAALADFVVTGWGDVSFPRLCRAILDGHRPAAKVISGEQPRLDLLQLPYRHYTDDDIAHRLIYVEASRGCPFKCEFCLSALDKTAWPFDPERFLAEMDALWRRGARHFKFVDRTFNLNVNTGRRILEFFLERLDERLFLHFEVVPDHLPTGLKEMIARFPPGSLQFEVGIQTFNPTVQATIGRRQDNAKAEANLRWLREHSNAHIHADLIAGLPGEDPASFAAGFDRLVALGPHEIQVGILKRLRGTPIIRHTEAHDMRYNPNPPYNLLANALLDFATMQRVSRFARYWDMVGNSGRFGGVLPLLLGNSPFAQFMAFSDWLYRETGSTQGIAVERLYDLVFRYLCEILQVDRTLVLGRLAEDYRLSGARGAPAFLSGVERAPGGAGRNGKTAARQARHVAASR